MFTNAGMNPFKEYFLVMPLLQQIVLPILRNAYVFQEKHNDLEEVGIDTYHHTFFEMLGNWSFGDYFKKEAIDWAWELLTQVYAIDRVNCMLPYLKALPMKILNAITKLMPCGKITLLKTVFY